MGFLWEITLWAARFRDRGCPIPYSLYSPLKHICYFGLYKSKGNLIVQNNLNEKVTAETRAPTVGFVPETRLSHPESHLQD